LISFFKRQCLAYTAATLEDGVTWKTTANGARIFSSKEKDDFHDAFRNAYIAFRLWLLEREAGFDRPTGARNVFGGWNVRVRR
jgi:hypothetical protein